MSKKKRKLHWYVIMADFNHKDVVSVDIFNHSYFAKDVNHLLDSDISKQEFSNKLRSYVNYYFWSKCEYEIIVDSFPQTSINKKLDVAYQLKINWDNFLNYVWGNK